MDGFECPDPFATQDTQRAEGSGRGEDNTNVEETGLDGIGDDQQGDAKFCKLYNAKNTEVFALINRYVLIIYLNQETGINRLVDLEQQLGQPSVVWQS